jgi:4-hydroxy-tetrahydrodipicolinate reductase
MGFNIKRVVTLMNILLSGATGAMGHTVTDLLRDSQEETIVAGYATDATEEYDYPVYQDIREVNEEVDVIIDFSSPDFLEDILRYSKENHTGLVLATTGFSEEQEQAIEEASEELPIVYSRNMSLGVNVLEIITKQLASMLSDFDIEIVERHHRYKKDSPSGTALMLYEAANEGREGELQSLTGRTGDYEERPNSEVGLSAVRGGTIVGEHTVIYAGEDEVIEIKHSAQSKKIFANGARQAARFVSSQTDGLYTMDDVLMGET